ncbi:MAG: hypothetical protein Q8S04_04010 [Bacteroidales bacterium]|nr:hypothetical protein [Bacteroidales bacterium]
MRTLDISKGTLIVFDNNNISIELPEGVSIIPAYKWLLTSGG